MVPHIPASIFPLVNVPGKNPRFVFASYTNYYLLNYYKLYQYHILFSKIIIMAYHSASIALVYGSFGSLDIMYNVLRKNKLHLILYVKFWVMIYSTLIRSPSSEVSPTITMNLSKSPGLSEFWFHVRGNSLIRRVMSIDVKNLTHVPDHNYYLIHTDSLITGIIFLIEFYLYAS